MTRSVVDEIKERLDIVEVVGGYVPLKKSGRYYKASCPFHHEKTASFFVFPDSGAWRCFGACSTGGDVISFVQKRENLDFREALRLLAERAGVDLDRDRDPAVLSQLNILYEINESAATYFHHQLVSEAVGAEARAYLERRAVNAETVERFQLGYASGGWEHLIAYLRGRGYDDNAIERAGLLIRREDGGVHDRFRHRLVIPIRDIQGRVIGFGGRILGAGEPKYLNSPQTPLFDKGDVIFALDLAKRSIRARDQVILVEGYMDVISAHQRGFSNVVAAMGTSVTPQQLKRLGRYTQNLVFALDADAAGVNATLRSIHTVREALVNPAVPVPTARGGMRYEKRLGAVIKIAVMPPGQDPDDVVRQDPDQWQQLIESATPLVDYYFQQAAGGLDLHSAFGKAELVKEMLPIISEIDDPIERRHYVGRLATLAGAPEREIDLQLEAYARSLGRISQRAQSSAPPEPDDEFGPPAAGNEAGSATRRTAKSDRTNEVGAEEYVLALLLGYPDLLAWADDELASLRLHPISAEDFQQPVNRAIFDAQQEFLYSDAAESSPDLYSRLDTSLRPHWQILWTTATRLERLRDEQRRKDLVDRVLHLRLFQLQNRCRELELIVRSASEETEDRAQWGQQLVRTTRDRKALEQALDQRSHTGRWFNQRPRLTS